MRFMDGVLSFGKRLLPPSTCPCTKRPQKVSRKRGRRVSREDLVLRTFESAPASGRLDRPSLRATFSRRWPTNDLAITAGQNGDAVPTRHMIAQERGPRGFGLSKRHSARTACTVQPESGVRTPFGLQNGHFGRTHRHRTRDLHSETVLMIGRPEVHHQTALGAPEHSGGVITRCLRGGSPRPRNWIL